jgi:hypothetical protein
MDGSRAAETMNDEVRRVPGDAADHEKRSR